MKSDQVEIPTMAYEELPINQPVPAIVRSIEDELVGLAKRINESHTLAEKAARTTLEHAHRAGRMLLQAKERVPHGEWLTWLKINTTLTARTAQRYMRVAKYDTVSYLTPDEGLGLLAGAEDSSGTEDGQAGIPGLPEWGRLMLEDGKIDQQGARELSRLVLFDRVATTPSIRGKTWADNFCDRVFWARGRDLKGHGPWSAASIAAEVDAWLADLADMLDKYPAVTDEALARAEAIRKEHSNRHDRIWKGRSGEGWTPEESKAAAATPEERAARLYCMLKPDWSKLSDKERLELREAGWRFAIREMDKHDGPGADLAEIQEQFPNEDPVAVLARELAQDDQDDEGHLPGRGDAYEGEPV